MKQPHTEADVDHADGQQDTGNHRAPSAKAVVPGGTRAGAPNVEKPPSSHNEAMNTVEMSNLDENLEE